MLLRISLIIAIVASLAAAALTHLKVADKITTLTTDLDATKTTLETTQASEKAAKTRANKAEGELRQTNNELATATNELAAVSLKASQQERRANELQNRMETVAQERNTVQQELAAWKAKGITPEQIDSIMQQLKDATIAYQHATNEVDVFWRNNQKLQARLEKYEGPDKIPDMPPIKGKVLAVDPKWEFIVLDVGAQQGAQVRGELLISRQGKLVAKVKLTSVEANRSIANVVSDWKQSDIMEGDAAIH
jgi:DNA repair exonuclease SbcCD ATPase subunit